MSQPFGVVDILIASEAAEYRLPKQPDQRMATVLAAARVGEHLTGGRSCPEPIIEFAPTSVGLDPAERRAAHREAPFSAPSLAAES